VPVVGGDEYASGEHLSRQRAHLNALLHPAIVHAGGKLRVAHLQYSRLVHCNPAMNFDLLILQVGFTGTGASIADRRAADSRAISSFLVFGTLTRSWTLRRSESRGRKCDQYLTLGQGLTDNS
jgi:hypothetical protein